jgi:signal transduction histidine kinase/DNA-binding response OmpR family regulator
MNAKMNLWRRLYQRGLSDSDSFKDKKRLQLVNTVCLLGMAANLLFAIVDVFQLLYKPIAGMLISLIFCVFIYGLNSAKNKKYRRLSRILLIIWSYIFIFLNSNFLFVGKLSEFLYLFVVVMAVILLDSFKLQVLILLICVGSFYLPNFLFPIYDPQIYGFANSALLFGFSFWMIRQLIDLNQQNEKKLLHDNEVIVEQKKQIEDFNQLKNQFFIDLSHEIRTPLTLLQGYLDNVMKSREIQNSDTIKKLEIIRQQGKNINGLVTNMLGMSKMENSNFGLNKKLISLSFLVDSIFSNFHYLFQQKDIKFIYKAFDKEVFVWMDAQLMSHAVSNLLTNALKYTTEKGLVTLGFRQDADHLAIVIEDTGIGIAQKDLDKIFERYYQVHDSAVSKGIGIGLSYTKRIVEAHGFSIEVSSELGKFTRFSILIPLDELIIETEHFEENSKAIDLSQKATIEKGTKILIAEDNKQMQELLSMILEDYHLTFTSNGRKAMQALSANKFDMLITDYAMPEMDGEELVTKVKEMKLSLPIIVLTARADESAKLKMLRLGVDMYMMKPFLRQELIHNIDRSLNLVHKMHQSKKELSKSEQEYINQHATAFNQALNEFVEENMRSYDFSVESIASHFNISKSTLNRRVKSLLGQTTKQIIMEARLQKARSLFLERPYAKNKEVADMVGISNSTYLKELLEKRFGKIF